MQQTKQQTAQPATKSFQCRHIRTTGRRCGSPSLRGEHFCYYHHPSSRPSAHSRVDAEAIADGYPMRLPTLRFDSFEDRPSVQLCLLEVMNRIACDAIDPKKAGMLLYGLQIASNNLPREPRAARTANQAAPVEPDCVPERLVEELTFDPDHGPLAPIAEIVPPPPERDPIDPITGEPRPSDMVERFLHNLSNEQDAYNLEVAREQVLAELAKIPCAHCGHVEPPAGPEMVPTIQAVAA